MRVGGEKLQENAFNTGASMRPVVKLGSSPLLWYVLTASLALRFPSGVTSCCHGLLKSIAV